MHTSPQGTPSRAEVGDAIPFANPTSHRCTKSRATYKESYLQRTSTLSLSSELTQQKNPRRYCEPARRSHSSHARPVLEALRSFTFTLCSPSKYSQPRCVHSLGEFTAAGRRHRLKAVQGREGGILQCLQASSDMGALPLPSLQELTQRLELTPQLSGICGTVNGWRCVVQGSVRRPRQQAEWLEASCRGTRRRSAHRYSGVRRCRGG